MGQNRGDNRDRKDKNKDEKTTEQNEWESVESFLEELSPGRMIQIYRVHPAWAAGFLENLEITPGEHVDVEYIVRRWGGRHLRLKLLSDKKRFVKGGTVDLILRTYPPKRFGKEISEFEDTPGATPKNVAKVSNDNNLIDLVKSLVQTNPQQAGDQTPIGDFAKLLAIFQQAQHSATNDNPLLQAVLNNATKRPVQPKSQIDDLLEMGEKFQRMQQIFGGGGGGFAGAPAQSEEVGLVAAIGDIAKAFMNRPQANPAPAPQREGKIVAPDQTRGPDITDILSGMDPDQLTNVLLTSLEKMPQNRKAETIETLMDKSGIAEQLAEQFGGEEEEDYFEPNDPDEFDNAEGGEDPIPSGPRGTTGPTETDGSDNR